MQNVLVQLSAAPILLVRALVLPPAERKIEAQHMLKDLHVILGHAVVPSEILLVAYDPVGFLADLLGIIATRRAEHLENISVFVSSA